MHNEDNQSIIKKCQWCSFKTTFETKLRRHLKSHERKTIKCVFCDKCYTNEKSLRDVNLINTFILNKNTYIL